MKQYTCNKPFTIGGRRFFIGDAVPSELIAPEREKSIIKYGLLSVSDAPDGGENKGTTVNSLEPPAPSSEKSGDLDKNGDPPIPDGGEAKKKVKK